MVISRFTAHVVERALGDLPIEDGKIFAEPIEFPQIAVDRLALVVRQFLAPESCPSPLIKQISVRDILGSDAHAGSHAPRS